MADNSSFQPQNQFALFSPDQWANKYSNYAGKALPFMGLYAGGATGPTDAHGNPIQSYQDAQAAHDAWAAANPAPAKGTTLNTSPTYGLQPSDLAGPSALNPTGNQALGMSEWGGMMSPQARQLYANQQFASPGQAQGSAPQPNGPQAARPAAAANPIDMNAAYLQALANPGKVTTPGATVPQSASPSNQSGVLQQFLQNWNQKGQPTQGAGNYNNAGFFNALQGQV